MNRIAKILSAVVSVTVALSIAVVMLTSALAAAAPTLSLNLASESGNKVVLEVKLDNGAFGSVDFGVNYNDAKVVKCENIGINIDIAMAGGVQATNPATGLYSAAIATGYDKEGGVVATYTFQVVDGAEITKDDFSLVVSNCTSVDNEALTATVVNKLPAAAPSTEPSTEATEPSTEATEPSTEATEPSTEATEPSTEATEPSTEATEPSTEATEPSTEAT
ncbi:MAG: hypothetical protein J6L62_05190, partial [Clostridia bacterium]|nr:hypothetical protein [Clostridia bacterium]